MTNDCGCDREKNIMCEFHEDQAIHAYQQNGARPR